MYEAFEHIIADCVFWFFIKHEYKLLDLLMEFLDIVDAIQLIDELPIQISIFPIL